MPEKRPSAGLDTAPVEATEDCVGGGTIETYTAVYDREGAPARGIIVGRSDDGKRFVANTPGDKDLLQDLVAKEGVGRRGNLSVADGMQVFTPS